MKYLRTIIGLALLATLADCNLPPQYTPPSNISAQTGASIAGSTIESGSIFSPNTNADLWAVDNQSTIGRKAPILVTPGTHILTVEISELGSLTDANVAGSATLMGNFKPGGNYTIHTTIPTGGLGWGQHFATVWIEDSTGVSITPKNKFEIDQGNPPIVKLFQN
jgi:hypothetical protein